MKTRNDNKQSGRDNIRRLQEALKESRAQAQSLRDSALDCFISTDDQGRITDFNSAAERTFRISRAAAVGKDLVDTILPPSARDLHRQELFQAMASGGTEVLGNRLETQGMRSDGTEFPAELTVNKIVIQQRTLFTVNVRDITARKRAEEAVVWLAAVVESSQDAIYGGDLEGKLTSWNKGAELMYGYTAQEAIGQSVSMLMPPGSPDEWFLLADRIREGLRTNTVETTRQTKDGRLLDVSLSVSPVLDSAGGMIGISAIARDISARKATEEALRRATETSVYASPVPIVAVDAERQVIMWNPAAEQVFGWTEKELLGRPNPIIPLDEADEAALLYTRLLSGETQTGVEVRRCRRDGSLVTLNLSGTPLWDENHKIKGAIKFLTDMTARKQAEEALRRAEEKYRSIFENAADGIYQTTRDGKYVSANPALAHMLGFDSADELIHARPDIATQVYVDSSRRAEFVQLMEERGVAQNFEYRAYRKDGKIIWVSENARAVRDAEGKIRYFEGSVKDITQQRELEQQMRQMQKIEAISRLAGGVAHDFNNILMAVSSFAELLHKKLPLNDAGRRYVDEIVKATDRGASLTQRLLAFSRKQVLSPKVIDLNALIADQIDMLKRLITETIELRFVPGPILGRAKLDPGQVEQVVMNLVVNARDAMPSGGELVIETGNVELDAAHSGSQDQLAAGPYIVLAVRDNGCGMDSDTKSHIFEPFFTTKGQGKGNGLGLATVFGIVKQSAGHISVDSEPGHGSTFKIYFPRVEEAAQPVLPEEVDVSFRGNETILLVEDDEAVRTPTAEYLAESGYTLLIARQGIEALAMAEQHPGPIHLLLTDLMMPKMSGTELAERINHIHPGTRVVFMSGYADDLLSVQQKLESGHVLLHKPFRLAALGRRIREALSLGERARAKASASNIS